MATANPIDMQIIGLEGRAELLRHAAKRLDVNPDRVVPNPSKFKQQQMAAAAQQLQNMQQMQPANPQTNEQTLMDGSPVTDNFSPSAQP